MEIRLPKDMALQQWFEHAVHDYEIPVAETGSIAVPVPLDRFLPAYPHTAVPEDTVYPWLTYEAAFGALDDGDIPVFVNLWFYTQSEAIPNAAARELSARIGRGGARIPCAEGYIWLKRDTPFVQSVRDDADPFIKRRYIRVMAEFFTLN